MLQFVKNDFVRIYIHTQNYEFEPFPLDFDHMVLFTSLNSTQANYLHIIRTYV